uniref:Uncharacterized protein n=1 Tax=Tetraselmis sp. GSL018 TaxID=582737 RepID=A0A061RA59_9CHLO|mmetsp:Transcript_3942/g.9435  ORF Transcript_3942/g.9435 Transcript_3942/m.9435 type:complete len:169 (+) Transcript_3942:556-1062(+)
MNMTPAGLPTNLRDQLTGMMEAAPQDMTSEIRPGCVLLTVDVRMSTAGESLAAQKALLRNLRAALADGGCGGPASAWWRLHDMDLQLPGASAQVRDGRVACLSETAPSLRIESAQPAAWWSSSVALEVSGLSSSEGLAVLCRVNGSSHELEILDTKEARPGVLQVRAR